jgi:hypothetical protein
MLRFSGRMPLSNRKKAELLALLEEQWERLELLLSHLIEEEDEGRGTR